MMILALEFSAPQRSVAIVDVGDDAVRMMGQSSDAGARDLKPLELIEQALVQANIVRTAIECIAVGLGPGSYTGIRSAISVAQGWQLARDVKLIGISTVECLAAQGQARGWFGTVHIVIDAQRNELYVAAYEIGEICKLIEPLHLKPVEELKKLLASHDRDFVRTHEISVVGPEVDRWFGEGRVLMPEAAQLGRLVAGRTDFVPGERIEPIYLREVQFVKAPPPRVIS